MWILAGGDDQVHLWRQVLEQKGEGIVNRFGINHMVVVQDKDEMVRDGGDFIEQGCQNRFDWRWLRGLENSQHPFSNIRRNRLQSSDEVSQKAMWGRYPLRPATARRPVARNQRPIR